MEHSNGVFVSFRFFPGSERFDYYYILYSSYCICSQPVKGDEYSTFEKKISSKVRALL